MVARARWSLLLCLALAGPLLAQDRGPPDPAAARELPPPVIPPPQAGQRYLRVMTIGDWGMSTPDQKAVAKAMAERAAREPIDLVLTLGDNFYPKGVKSVDDPLWQRAFEKVYDQPSLQVPWWVTLGNHDHLGNIEAQLEYSNKSPRWKLPARYYTTRFELDPGTTVQLFALDTDTIVGRNKGADSDAEQLRWLETELGRSTARWKVVAGHHPIYSRSSHGNDEPLRQLLEPVLVKGKADLYLAGHDHALQLFKPVQGVHHLVSGGGAGALGAYKVEWTEDMLYGATRGGVACLRFGKDECLIEFVRLDARTQFAHVILKPGATLGPY